MLFLLMLFSVGLFLSFGWPLIPPAPKPEDKLVAEGVHIEGQAVGGLSAQEAGKILTTLASAKDVSAVNAGFNPVTGSVIPERPGQRIEISATLNELLAAQAGSIVTPVYQSFLPEITRDVLARSHLIGTFTTPILDKSPGRLTNIRLTAKLVNNTLIAPGQEFSFNQVTGEPTEARGFQPAIIFGDRGEEEQGLGGGMCQVSSTIYNAALAGELSVTERHPHSRPVAYVPPGKDAATYTDKDLRFINTTRWRLLTRVFIHDESSQLTVDLWALPDA